MSKIMMCEPKFFQVCYDINPWMKNNTGQVGTELALRQWQTLHQKISELADVVLVAPEPDLPDMVFTANAGLVYQGRCIVSNFRHPQRQPEAGHFARFFIEQGFHLSQFSQPYFFEGAGDALFDCEHRLWIASGFRSDPHVPAEIHRMFGVTVLPLQLIDPRWYHLDTAFCPLSSGFVMAYRFAFSEASQQLIEVTLGDKVIWVSEEDALNFACNAVNIDAHVILNHASESLAQALVHRGFYVIQVPVGEFMKAGGACKCLTLAL